MNTRGVKFNKKVCMLPFKKNIMKDKKKLRSNIFTGVLVAFVIAMFVFPSFKGTVMQGLMKVGLFQPSIPKSSQETSLAEFSSTQDEQVLLENNNGEVVQLASLKGQVVFVNFWATWCPPCIAEMPTIQKMYDEFKGNDKFEVLMVDVDNKRDKSQNFMDKRKFDLPLYTPVSPIPTSYLGGAIPTTLVLNKYGQVVFKHEGMGNFSSKKFIKFLYDLIEE